MKGKRKLPLFIFFLLFFSCMTFFSYTDKVIASYDGTYYICNFSQYADNSYYCNESSNGIEWLKIKGGGSGSTWGHVTSNYWYQYDADSGAGAETISYFNFSNTLQISHLNFTILSSACDNGAGEVITFYGINEHKLFSIEYNYNPSYYIRNKDGTIVKSISVSGIQLLLHYVSIDVYPSNSSYFINIFSTSGSPYDVNCSYWYVAHPNFDYIGRFTLTCSGYYLSGAYVNIDNIYASTTTAQLWETDMSYYLTHGSVTENMISTQNLSFSSTTSYLVESQLYSITAIPLYLRQFALTISTSSLFSGITHIGISINNIDCGYYNNVYYGGDRYILVWKNINYTFSYPLNIELYLYKTSDSPYLNLVLSQTDKMGFGNLLYKYSDDNMNYLNGLFDGENTISGYDFIYKIWYNVSYTSGGTYGSPEYQNDTLCTPVETSGTSVSPYVECFAGQFCNDAQGIEEHIDLPSDIYLNALDLRVDKYQYNLISNSLTNYQLYINGNKAGSTGNPSYFFSYDGGNTYILRWLNIGMTISKDTGLNLEFISLTYHSENIFRNFFWMVSVTNYDDGLSGYYHAYSSGNVPNYFANGVIDGDIAYNDKTDNYKHLCICFYYGKKITYPEGLTDTINLNPPDITSFMEYRDTVQFQITRKTNEVMYVQIWNDTGRMMSDGYGDIWGTNTGYLVSKFPYDYPSWHPKDNTVGNYIAHLVYGGNNISNVSFTVTSIPENMRNALLYVEPEPSNSGQLCNIGWLYNPNNFNGDTASIVIGTSSNFNPYSDKWLSDITGDGTNTYTFNNNGIYYLWLCRYNATNYPYYFSIYPYTHRVGITFVDVVKTNGDLRLTKIHDIISATQHFYGSHSHVGEQIYVKVNDKYYDVSGSNTINFDVQYFDSGFYQVSLVLRQLNHETNTLQDVILYPNASFTIFPYSLEQEKQNNPFNFLDEKSQIILGLVILLIISMIPVVLTRTFNLFAISLFGIIGCIIDVIIGLLPYYVPATIILFLVFLVLGLYIAKR